MILLNRDDNHTLFQLKNIYGQLIWKHQRSELQDQLKWWWLLKLKKNTLWIIVSSRDLYTSLKNKTKKEPYIFLFIKWNHILFFRDRNHILKINCVVIKICILVLPVEIKHACSNYILSFNKDITPNYIGVE